MTFAITGLLTILLHMAPMTAGMAWSVYKDGGVTVNHVGAVKPVKPSKGIRR